MSNMDRSSSKNMVWSPPNEWQYVPIQVLMDIRNELQAINATLRCHNTQAIPRYLKRIANNTAKKRRRT